MSADPAADAGIHRLSLPTPFAVGRVNVYLIEDEPLTLIDTGPNSGQALDELERGLAALGRRIEDLELVVLTHQHIDHLGLAAILARRSGAEVAALDRLVTYVQDFEHAAERDDEYAEAIMRRHGIPGDMVYALRAVSAAFRGWGAGVEVAQPLSDGGVLALRDRTLRVLHRPGHSPSDTVFFDERRRLLIGGDHLLSHISSNPLVSRPLHWESSSGEAGPSGGPAAVTGPGRPQALVTYMRSLRATREMPIVVVLPGHGEPVTDHVALIDERFALHERRAAKIARLLADGPRTAHELAQALWGKVAMTQAYLTLSEVLGHLDLLLETGTVRELEGADGVSRFEAVA